MKKRGTPKGPEKRKKSARGVLWTVALMLTTSGAIRLGAEFGPAIAAGMPSDPDETLDMGACQTLSDVSMILDALKGREQRVSERESKLQERLAALTFAEEQIARNMKILEATEDSLRATMALSASAAEDDLVRLTAVYESMKPKDAAPLFAAMDPQFAAGFLGRMRPDSAALILAGLTPDKAYAISVLLASRNAEAPTE